MVVNYKWEPTPTNDLGRVPQRHTDPRVLYRRHKTLPCTVLVLRGLRLYTSMTRLTSDERLVGVTVKTV